MSMQLVGNKTDDRQQFIFLSPILTRKNISLLCAQLEILISRSVQIVNKILSPTLVRVADSDVSVTTRGAAGGASAGRC